MNNPPSDSNPPSSAEGRGAKPDFTLTVEDASRLFAEAGTPRAPRTVMRYSKQGHLDSIKADTDHGERYLITRESVDRKIAEIRRLAGTRHDETRRDPSRHDAPAGEPSRQRDPSDADPDDTERLRDLEAKIYDLEITNRAKDYFLEQLRAERAALLDQVSSKSHQIGQLETRLQLNAGPPPESPETQPTIERPKTFRAEDDRRD